MRIILLILILAGPQVQAIAQEEQGFELQAVDDNISVWIRPEANNDLTVRVAVKSTASVKTIQALFDDAQAYPRWVHRCKEAGVLPGGTANAYTYFSRVSLPFPFSDREVVAAITQSIDPVTGVYTRVIKSTPDALPLKKGVQRIKVYDAVWEVKPLKGGNVLLNCTVRTAAGAGLPSWLRNDILTGGPVKSLKGLLQEAEKK